MKSAGDSKAENAGRLGGRAAEFATALEFCAIFERDMTSLYQLSLALTGSHQRAEQSFLAALESCKSANVFRNWAHSWSRLAVIESAIRIVHPVPGADSDSEPEKLTRVSSGIHPDAARVMELDTFDRFIFVLSVLDQYSVRDCAILLRCTRQEVDRARRRAVAFIANTGRQLPEPVNRSFTSTASI